MPHPPLEEDLGDNETSEVDTSHTHNTKDYTHSSESVTSDVKTSHTHSTKDHTQSSNYDHVPQEPVTIAESLDKLFTNHETTPTPLLETTPTPLLEVLYDFEAENATELSVCEGERVVLLSDVDPQGNKEWCLVMNQHQQQGYVPCNYLSKH